MSQTIIEKLLNSAEVEWKTLGEIVKIKTGALVNKNTIQNNPGVYPVINSGKEPLGFIKYWNTECDPIGITTRGAGVGSVTWQEGRYFRGNLNYSVTIKDNKKLLVRYLFYSLTSQQKDIQNLATYSGIPALNAAELKKLRVPIPLLSVQKEIVGILDAFTAHTAELTAELNERKKQYNYYRDKLLTFSDDEVEWKPLGEVCEFKNGFAFKSRLFKEEGNPIVRITNIDGNFVNTDDVKYFQMKDYKEDLTSYTVNKGDIIIAMSGATTGKIGLYNYEYTSYLNQRVGKFIPKQKILNNKYLYHFLLLKINDIFLFAGGGAQPNLSSKKLMEKFKIPIPPLSVQKEIVRILDSFWTLTTSISEGLPREIELRNKQYEYYRDQLLNFPKPGNDAIKHNSTNR